MADKKLADLPASNIYFGEHATGYDKGRTGNPVTDEDDAAIRQFVSSFSPHSIVADAPCGTGRAMNVIIAAGHQYRGADISADMLKECAAKAPAGSKIDLSVADARNLPWDDGSCDYLLSFKFLKWLPNDETVFEVLKEYRRVCRGRALINVKIEKDFQEYTFRELWDRIAKIKDRLTLGASARSINRNIFEDMCKRAGWSIIDFQLNKASNDIVNNYYLT